MDRNLSVFHPGNNSPSLATFSELTSFLQRRRFLPTIGIVSTSFDVVIISAYQQQQQQQHHTTLLSSLPIDGNNKNNIINAQMLIFLSARPLFSCTISFNNTKILL